MSEYFSLSVLQLLQGWKKLLFAFIRFISLQISTIALHNNLPNTLALYIPKRDGINMKKILCFCCVRGKKNPKKVFMKDLFI